MPVIAVSPVFSRMEPSWWFWRTRDSAEGRRGQPTSPNGFCHANNRVGDQSREWPLRCLEGVGENRFEHELVRSFRQAEPNSSLQVEQLASEVDHSEKVVLLLLASVDVAQLAEIGVVLHRQSETGRLVVGNSQRGCELEA